MVAWGHPLTAFKYVTTLMVLRIAYLAIFEVPDRLVDFVMDAVEASWPMLLTRRIMSWYQTNWWNSEWNDPSTVFDARHDHQLQVPTSDVALWWCFKLAAARVIRRALSQCGWLRWDFNNIGAQRYVFLGWPLPSRETVLWSSFLTVWAGGPDSSNLVSWWLENFPLQKKKSFSFTR